jgi:hypothetical protein
MEIQIERTQKEPERPIPISSATRTFTTQASMALERPGISWRGVFAGLLVACLAHLTLVSLGIALGGSSLKALIGGTSKLGGIAASSALWFILASAISLYLGSYAAGKLSGTVSVRVGQLQGVVVSALFFALVLSQAGSTLGAVSRGFSGALGTLGQTPTEVGKNPMVQDAIRNALGKIPLKSPPDQVASELATRLIRGNRTGARDYLAQQTGLSTKDAETKLSQLMTAAEETLKSIGETTAQIISVVGWTLFTALIFGTLFSSLGGGAGVASELRLNLQSQGPHSRSKQSAA